MKFKLNINLKPVCSIWSLYWCHGIETLVRRWESFYKTCFSPRDRSWARGCCPACRWSRPSSKNCFQFSRSPGSSCQSAPRCKDRIQDFKRKECATCRQCPLRNEAQALETVPYQPVIGDYKHCEKKNNPVIVSCSHDHGYSIDLEIKHDIRNIVS